MIISSHLKAKADAKMREDYLEQINIMLQDCNDISLIDLILAILNQAAENKTTHEAA